MNRRNFLGLLWQLPIIVSGFGATLARAYSWRDDDGKLYYLTNDKNSEESIEFLTRLKSYLFKRGYGSLRITNWDLKTDSEEISLFLKRYAGGGQPLQFPLLVAVPPSGPDVELWNTDWLKYAERTQNEACYPVSGGWWSVEGDWNPSITKVRKHLYESPNHESGHFFELWLQQLNFEELQSLHSDHHREMTNAGKVFWKKVNVECPH